MHGRRFVVLPKISLLSSCAHRLDIFYITAVPVFISLLSISTYRLAVALRSGKLLNRTEDYVRFCLGLSPLQLTYTLWCSLTLYMRN